MADVSPTVQQSELISQLSGFLLGRLSSQLRRLGDNSGKQVDLLRHLQRQVPCWWWCSSSAMCFQVPAASTAASISTNLDMDPDRIVQIWNRLHWFTFGLLLKDDQNRISFPSLFDPCLLLKLSPLDEQLTWTPQFWTTAASHQPTSTCQLVISSDLPRKIKIRLDRSRHIRIKSLTLTFECKWCGNAEGPDQPCDPPKAAH